MAGLGGVGADTLTEAAEFIGVGEVPDVFVVRIITELLMLQGLAGGGVNYREVPVGDEVGWVLTDCIIMGCEGDTGPCAVCHWLGERRRDW